MPSPLDAFRRESPLDRFRRSPLDPYEAWKEELRRQGAVLPEEGDRAGEMRLRLTYGEEQARRAGAPAYQTPEEVEPVPLAQRFGGLGSGWERPPTVDEATAQREAVGATFWGDYMGGLAEAGAFPGIASQAIEDAPLLAGPPQQVGATALAKLLAGLVPESYEEHAPGVVAAAEGLRDRAQTARYEAGVESPIANVLAGMAAENVDFLADLPSGVAVGGGALAALKTLRRFRRPAAEAAEEVAEKSPRLLALEAMEAKADALAESGRLRPEDLPVLSEAIKDAQRLAALGDEEGSREVLRRVEGMMNRTFPDETTRTRIRRSDEIADEAIRKLETGERDAPRSFEDALREMGMEPEKPARAPTPERGPRPEDRLPFQYNFRERFDLDDDAVESWVSMMEDPEYAADIARARRADTAPSMAELRDAPEKLALANGLSTRRFLDMQPGATLNAEELAVLDTMVRRAGDRATAASRAVDAARTGGGGNLDQAKVQLAAALYEQKALLARSIGASTELGRALRSRQELMKALADCFP